MMESLALLAYAGAAGTLGAAALRRANWVRSAPRLGVLAWQVLSVSVLAALLFAGASAVVPSDVISTNLAAVLQACVMALRAQYSTPGGALVHVTAVSATIVLAVRAVYLLTTGLRGARRAGQEHLGQVRLAARTDTRLDVLVLEHPAAVAYCLPGGAGTVVLTSAAVLTLTEVELAAVLAHERAHLRGRHHLITATATAMQRTVPVLPVFRWAATEQARLLEMIADDAAAERGHRVDVARALVRLAEGSVSHVPHVALGAADIAALDRVQRLVAPARTLSGFARGAVGVVIAATALLPVTIAGAPAYAATRLDYCPVPTAQANV